MLEVNMHECIPRLTNVHVYHCLQTWEKTWLWATIYTNANKNIYTHTHTQSMIRHDDIYIYIYIYIKNTHIHDENQKQQILQK